jgi:methionyl-tRNA formyltransferase
MDTVFLGVNNFGWEIYEWLCDRNSVTVRALITEPDQLELVHQIQPDVIVASGFGEIVPESVLEIPDRGAINVHPGYLPHTRGYNPNVWSIVEKHPAGVSIHLMESEVDAGDIIARREVEESFDDNGKTLYKKIEAAAVDLFVDTWPDIEDDTFDTISQDDSKAMSHQKQDFRDLCELDPEAEYRVKDLLDILRALTYPPFDNAYVELEDEKYYLEIDIQKSTSEAKSEGFTSRY